MALIDCFDGFLIENSEIKYLNLRMKGFNSLHIWI